MATLGENTKVKLGFLVTILGLVASVFIWVGTIQAKVERSEGVYKSIEDINTRLSHIEGALGIPQGKKAVTE